MRRVAPDVAEAVSGVEHLSATGYSVRGQARSLEPSVASLASDLYARLYTRPRAGAGAFDPLAGRDLVTALATANSGRGTWETGWTAAVVDGGHLVVERDGLKVWVTPDAFESSQAPVRPGDRIRIRVGKDLQALLPGYYMALGDTCEDADTAEPLVRLYWHATHASAVLLCRQLTTALNEAAIPFRFKLLSHPAAYLRADAAVLYIRRDFLLQGARLLVAVHEALGAGLRDDIPLMTHRLAAGLGLAEDPGDGLSFGQHRCRLIAQALWSSLERGETSLEERIEAVAQAFVGAGLDPERPHLRPGSTDGYPALFGLRRKRRAHPQRRTPGRTRVARRTSPLTAAVRIGDDLCRAALWHEGRCNWLGRSLREGDDRGRSFRPTVTALGPDLYAGTAGVALFLAQLHGFTGKASHRRTAMGALCQALSRVEAIPGPERLGFYAGALGVAYATGRVGELLDQPELVVRATALAAGALVQANGEHPLDVIVGNAGAVCSLLAMSRWPGGESFLEAALSLGEEIRDAAIRDEGRCSWDNKRATGSELGERPLTGLSHGASGMALALLELHARTGRDEFLEVALGGFAYEDAAFSPTHDNWPDLRSGAAEAYTIAWCHGAPGIGLARLRASSLLPDRQEELRPAVEAALRSTEARLDELERAEDADATPCHGLAGLVELLLVAADALERPELLKRAERAWKAEMGKRARHPVWTTGVPSGGFNPSLMVGTAGIGHALLRLHDRARVSSVLLLPS